MTARPNNTTPNILVMLDDHLPANLAECEGEIAEFESKLATAKLKRETLRAVARAAGHTLDAPELPPIGSPQLLKEA